METQNGFEEVTYMNPKNGWEMFVDRDVKTKEVLGIYTYNDSVPDSLCYGEIKNPFPNWQTGKNPLFVHCPANDLQTAMKIIKKVYVECTND